MPVAMPFVRSSFVITLLGASMLGSAARAQSADPGYEAALRSVVSAAYLRAGQSKSPAQLDTLVAAGRPLVTFDPRAATEADILGLVGRLGLTDASLPPPPAPVALTRTLSTAPLPAYDGAADLTSRSVTDLAGMLQRGETTSREIVLQYLYKIQKLDHAGPALRSVQQINPDLLALADQMDARRADAKAKGVTLPELFGIPILLKDNIGTDDGLRNLASSAALIGSKVTQDSTVAAQLRQDGAIMMGKTLSSEFASFRQGYGRTGAGGLAVDPYDPKRALAGSSTGSGIAAAMSFAPVTLGTETNGSIMNPSNTYHVYGLKPTPGLTSRTGVIPGVIATDTVGPLGNSVTDLATVLGSMAAQDASDPLSAAGRPEDHKRDYVSGLSGRLDGIRVGFYAGSPNAASNTYNNLVSQAVTSSGGTIVPFGANDVSAALRKTIDALPFADAAELYKLAWESLRQSKALPSDPAARKAAFDELFQKFPGREYNVYATYNFQILSKTGSYQEKYYIDQYMAGRVGNTADYSSAFVRLLGDKFTPINGDKNKYVSNFNEINTFNASNKDLEDYGNGYPLRYIDTVDSFSKLSKISIDDLVKAAGFSKKEDLDAAIDNWSRISTDLMNGIRRNLGVDATIDLLSLFSQIDFAYARSPQLSIPLTVNGTSTRLGIDSNPYQEATILKIGSKIEQTLADDAFSSLRPIAPTPPETGFSNQPADKGPLLPLVLNDLDDHDRASRAHLLTTEMAPLVLNSTTAATDTRFDGRISGNGGLIKDGAGTQRLTGTSDFTGAVQVWNGTLAVDRTAALGDPANAVTLEKGAGLFALQSFTLGRSLTLRDGGTLGVAEGQTLVQDQLVSGNGGLTKTGTGQLTLTADNTYTGGTFIAAGILSVSREANLGQPYGAVTIADAATLSASASFVTTRPFTLQGAAGLAVTAGATLTASNTLSGAGTLTKLGAGTLTLTGANTYAGGTTIAAGTLQIGDGGTAGSIVGDVLDNATLAFNRSDAVTFAGAVSGTGSLNQIGTGTLTLTGANTYSGATLIAAGTLEARGGRAIGDLSAVTVAAGAALALRDSETIGSLAGGGSVALGSARLTAGGNDASTLFAGFLSGAGGLTKTGLGTLTLTGANTYTGATLIATGTLEARGGRAIGDLSAVTVAAGAALALRDSETIGSLAGGGSVVLGSARLTAGGNDASTLFAGFLSGAGGLTKAGLGTLTLTGANTYAGGTAIAAGTLQIGNGGTTGSIVGDVLDNATLAFNRSDAVTFAGTIAGTGSLNQIGTGTLTLTGASTYAGRTTVAAGGLALTSTASLVSPVLTLAGATLTNAGRLAGGLDNAGTTTTSGLVAGGVTNTGTFTATAGQVNGPIRNLAGRFDVTGAVSSDAAFANATGAALTVSGDYSLAGLLTNAGTLTVAAGARLAAAGVDNAGVLTVAAEASVIDALNNTGFVNNAGTYTADASNAAGATLINTGTFSTVSQPFANAGALMTTGVLNGGLTNSGTVQAAGQLNGAVANTGLIQLTGTTTGITRLTNDGAFDLGATALSVGSLAGSAAAATLGNGRLTAGADGSSTTYAGRIVDGAVATGLTKVGGGTLTLAGDNVFTGPLTVLGGELAVTGTLSGAAASLGAGSLLSGQATFASLTLGRGGTVAPGAGPGTVGRIAVTGDLGFAPGATYQVDATADGRSDRIVAGGRATLAGAAVQAIADTGQYAPRTRYAILTAGGGLSGQFAGVTANFAFLTPFLGYDANAVYLTLARNDLDFAAVAVTRNQRGAAAAVQAGAVGSPLYDAVATLSAGSARAAFAALSGDAHASLVSTAFATAGLLREAVLDRLRWDALPEEGMDYGTLPAAYTADGPRASVPARVLEPQVFTLWGQGFGSTGRVGSDGNAAALSRTTSGFMFGADARLEAGLQLGLAGGYRTTSFASPGTAEAGTVDGVFGGLYGGYRIGPVAVRFGALAADDAVSLRRLVLFPGFSGTPSGRTGGTTVQGFGEVGYQIDLGARPTAALIEPFVGGAAVAVRRDRFTEQGGPAALGGAARGDLIPAGTVGVRGQTALDLGPGVPAVAHGLVGYRHAFGDVTPIARETILGTGASFVSAGLPIDRDALVAEAGLSIQVAANAVLGVAYTGQVGSTAQDHTAKGNFTLRW